MTFVEWITFRATRAMRGFHTAYGGFHTLGSRAILYRTLRGAELSPLRTARQNTPMLAKWYRVPPEKCDVFLYHSLATPVNDKRVFGAVSAFEKMTVK